MGGTNEVLRKTLTTDILPINLFQEFILDYFPWVQILFIHVVIVRISL
jgi:hypothetical protein